MLGWPYGWRHNADERSYKVFLGKYLYLCLLRFNPLDTERTLWTSRNPVRIVLKKVITLAKLQSFGDNTFKLLGCW